MPASLGELHYELHHQVVWLHLKWQDFRGLYASEPETVDLLNAAAPGNYGGKRVVTLTPEYSPQPGMPNTCEEVM